MTSLKLAPINMVGRLRLAIVFVPALTLLLAACGTRAPNSPSNPYPILNAPVDRTPPPIDPQAVRADVERHESWGRIRKAACPRRLPDRSEQLNRWHALSILHGLKYVTMTDDTSRGTYDKVITLTPAGRQVFREDLVEEADRYVIAIARREYLAGLERFEKCAKRDNCIVAGFRWQWKGLNPLGERIDLSAPFSTRPDHEGRATYVRTADGWKLEDLFLHWDHRDYMSGI